MVTETKDRQLSLEEMMREPPKPAPTIEGLGLADKAHLIAEQARLDTGYEGCGCALCQDYYKTIDLSKYGSRVKDYGGVVVIAEDRQAIARLYGDDRTGADQIYLVAGQGYAVNPDGSNLFMGAADEIKEAIASRRIPADAMPGQRAEYNRIFQLIDKEIYENGEQRSFNAKRSAPKPNRPADKRVRPGRIVRHKQPNIRRPATQPRAAVPGAKPKQQGVPGKRGRGMGERTTQRIV